GTDPEDAAAAAPLPKEAPPRRDPPDLALAAQQADLFLGQPQFWRVSGWRVALIGWCTLMRRGRPGPLVRLRMVIHGQLQSCDGYPRLDSIVPILTERGRRVAPT